MRFIRRPSRGLVLGAALAAALAFPLGAIANHGFTDVASSNLFHADIDALVDSGVTSGCGDGNFCPKAYVTREQMAAFMNRLGALGPGKVPVVNADGVDGYDANQLTRVAGATTEDQTLLDTSGLQFVSVSVKAPRAGYVLVDGATSLAVANCTSACYAEAWLRHPQGNENSTVQITSVETGYDQLSLSYVFPVTPGDHTFVLGVRRGNGNGSLYARKGLITAQFSPFGPTGASGS